MMDDTVTKQPTFGMGNSGTAGPPDQADSAHLTTDLLSAYLDSAVSADERARVEAHLRACAVCQRDLADLRATVNLLRQLPEHRPRRSFQLSPEQARTSRAWWARSGARLMPTLPALRAATVAVAVLLVVVSAGDVLTSRSGRDTEPQATMPIQTVPAAAPTVPVVTSTATAQEPLVKADDESSARHAQAPAPQSTEDTLSDQADVAPAEAEFAAAPETVNDAAGTDEPALAMAAAEPDASPATDDGGEILDKASAEDAAVVAESATPPVVMSEAEAQQPRASSNVSAWRIAQLGLAFILLWLIVSVVGLQRLRARREPSAGR